MILKKNRTSKSFARVLLRMEMAILLIFLAIFLQQYFVEWKIDPLLANSYYAELAEYIIASFVIALASSLLVERLEREAENNSL